MATRREKLIHLTAWALLALAAVPIPVHADPSHQHCAGKNRYMKLLYPNVCIEGRLYNIYEIRCSVDGDLCEIYKEDLNVKCGSPLIIDFGAAGFQLTDFDGGVSFDIDGDGSREEIAWTAPDAKDAFIALDRNHNGAIDDGGELFGDATRLVDGSLAPNGYEALRDLDLKCQGGNENGYIDSGDDAYWRLLLWTDRDHDGISQSQELARLSERDVAALALDYSPGPGEDEHGNVHSFISQAYLIRHGKVVNTQTADVYFLVAP